MRCHAGTQSLAVVGFLTAGITAVHALAYWSAPYQPPEGATTAWAVIVLYQGAVVATAALFGSLGGRHKATSGISQEQLLGGEVDGMLTVLAAISALGLLFHYFGKWPLLVEARSGCLGELREIFLRFPREKLTELERAASKTGHLLSNFYAPGLIMASATLVSRGWGVREVAWLVLFVMMAVLYAFPMVSRSVLLTMLWMVTCTSVAAGLTVRAQHRWLRSLGVAGVVAIVVIALSAVVFVTKIECIGPALVEDNVDDFIPIRGQQSEEGARGGDGRDGATAREGAGMLWGKCAVCALMLTYLNHGVWNLAKVVSTEESGSPVLFAFASYWAVRLGIGLSAGARGEEGKRVYGPGGLTLPGAAYHDFGWRGVVVAGMVVGALLGLGLRLMRCPCWWWEGMAIFVLGGVVEGESLLFVAPGTLSFPFVAVSTLAWLVGMRAWRLRNTRGRVTGCDEE